MSHMMSPKRENRQVKDTNDLNEIAVQILIGNGKCIIDEDIIRNNLSHLVWCLSELKWPCRFYLLLALEL